MAALNQVVQNREQKHHYAISVIGLGYVGAVSVACLANIGHSVVGVDNIAEKVNAISMGLCPMHEKGLGRLLSKGIESHLISATRNLSDAIMTTDITFVSVGTPTLQNGGCNLTALKKVCEEIARSLNKKSSYHLIVIRSSVPPGTTLEVLLPILEKLSGKKLNKDFDLCFNPEFLREGVAIEDFYAPAKTVVGATSPKAANILKNLYQEIDHSIIQMSIKAAEMTKYVDNTWHATKVAFANEIGRLSKSVCVDSHEIMNAFIKDTKLNLSAYYLKPGFAYGGSCLPKEVRAMQHLAKVNQVNLPMLQNLSASNDAHIESSLNLIRSTAKQNVGILGLTFKPDTDDLRESPQLQLIHQLMQSGFTVRWYDPLVKKMFNGKSCTGKIPQLAPSLRYLSTFLPYLACNNINDLCQRSDTLIVAHNTEEFRDAAIMNIRKKIIVDLVHLNLDGKKYKNYRGLCW